MERKKFTHNDRNYAYPQVKDILDQMPKGTTHIYMSFDNYPYTEDNEEMVSTWIYEKLIDDILYLWDGEMFMPNGSLDDNEFYHATRAGLAELKAWYEENTPVHPVVNPPEFFNPPKQYVFAVDSSPAPYIYLFKATERYMVNEVNFAIYKTTTDKYVAIMVCENGWVTKEEFNTVAELVNGKGTPLPFMAKFLTKFPQFIELLN